jgi:hypothetical protein
MDDIIESTDVFKTIIIVCKCFDKAKECGGGEMFTTPLSQSGQEPATHYISSGYINKEVLEAFLELNLNATVSDSLPFDLLLELDLKLINTEL